MKGGVIHQLSFDLHPIDGDVVDVTRVDVGHELREVLFFIFLTVAGAFHYFPQQQGRDTDE